MGSGGQKSMSSKSKVKNLTVLEQAMNDPFVKRSAETEISFLNPNGIGAQIPQWIINRESDGLRKNFQVKRETEKAILVSSSGDASKGIRNTEFWVPKSQLQSVEKTKQEIWEKHANRAVSEKYTAYLNTTAESAGVKVGNLSSWDKITAKLQKSGVAVMTRDEFKNSKA